MYKLVFKGKDTEPIFLPDEKGTLVMDAYLQNKSVRLVANNQAFNTGDIKSITLVEKTRAEQNARTTVRENDEYLEFRRNMLSLSIEKRAAILRIPKLVWQASTDRVMTDEDKRNIKERQLAYFTEHPNCIYANPACYQDLVSKRPEIPVRDGVKSLSSLVGPSMLSFIERAIRTDLELSRA